MFHLISFNPHFIDYVSSHFLYSTLHCSCCISFPSVHSSLFMFNLISISPHFIVHVASYFLQSTVHCFCLISFPSVHSSLFMWHLISSSPDFIDHVLSHSLQSTVHHIHFIYHSPSHSHLPYLFVLILHSHPTLCHFHFSANPFCRNKRTRGVFLDKVLITNVYLLLEAELLWFLLLLVSLFQRTNTALESFCRVLF